MHAQSAQSGSCKRNVHKQEVLRRLLNSSARLDWDSQVAPVITTYMGRMKTAGYPEKYRKEILQHGLGIYEKMRRDDESGTRPIYRPRDWQAGERRRTKKKKKKHDWSTRGGHVAPIFVPPTPNGELARILREVAEGEAEAGVWFKVMETGGTAMKSTLQIPNPTATLGCTDPGCVACRHGRGGGGDCKRSNITYELECQQCPDGGKSKYIGESSRNLFTRGKEHESNLRKRSPKSFMLKHQQQMHQGAAGHYTAQVTGSSRDCLTRQVMEAVKIRRCQYSMPRQNGTSPPCGEFGMKLRGGNFGLS